MTRARPGAIGRAALVLLAACIAFAVGPFPRGGLAVAEDDVVDEAAAREELLRRAPWFAFQDRTRSREEIRDRLAEWVSERTEADNDPWATQAMVLSEWIPILDRMIAEDAAHQPPSRPLDDLPADARIAELIYRLRDVTRAAALWNPGWPDFHTPPVLGDATAADLLVREGHVAVPALIATLGDARLTRCFGTQGGGAGPSPETPHWSRVMRVGEIASTLLVRIAGRPFRPPPAAAGQTRDFGASLRPVVQGWWDAVQEKGEFLATADELQSTTGQHAEIYLAWRLAALDPHAAAPLVVRVARASSDPMRRKLLLDLLDRLDGPGVTEFLHHELEHGPFLLHRVAAAFSLRDRGEDGRAKIAVQAAWRGPLDFGTCPNVQWARDTVRLGIHQAAAFLASSRDPEAVADLGRGLGERPAAARAAVAKALAGGPDEYGRAAYFGRLRYDAGVPGIDDGVARSLLRPLLDDLDDPDDLNGIVWLTPSRSMPADTRVADLAAASLARREPSRYEFQAVAPPAARDAAIAVIRISLDKAAKR